MKKRIQRQTFFENFFHKGFTILEVLIVIAIIGLIAVIAFVLIDPFTQIKKANDTRVKADLALLKRSLEDFYNDKGCYPAPDQICYDPTANPNGANSTFVCHICGNQSTPDDISSYIKLPCHPLYSSKNYLYHTDNNTCPTWYRIYSELEVNTDSDIRNVGCMKGSCGPLIPHTYDYGVPSSNVDLERSVQFYCASYNQTTGLYDCNVCGSYDQCVGPSTTCSGSDIHVWPDFPACCLNSPNNSCGTYMTYCKDSYNNCNPCGSRLECATNLGLCPKLPPDNKQKLFDNSACM